MLNLGLLGISLSPLDRLFVPLHGQPRQPPLAGSHDHPRPRERREGVALGEEPRTRRPEGGRPREQDGLRDLSDQAASYQGIASSVEPLSHAQSS